MLTQLSIVLGIMLTQAVGLYLATPRTWRFVLIISALLSLAQVLVSPLVVESPVYLGHHGQPAEQKAVAARLWGVQDNDEVREALLEEEEEQRAPAARVKALSVPEVFKARELRTPLIIIIFAMLSQQTSGINAGRCRFFGQAVRYIDAAAKSCITATIFCRSHCPTSDHTSRLASQW